MYKCNVETICSEMYLNKKKNHGNSRLHFFCAVFITLKTCLSYHFTCFKSHLKMLKLFVEISMKTLNQRQTYIDKYLI